MNNEITNNTYDVIVIGGGIMGSSITYSLAKLGKKVLLLEKEDLTKGSAGATDGVVGYHTKSPGEQMELAIKSIELFENLEQELGEDIEYCNYCGGMQPVESKEEWDILSDIVEQQKKSGVDIEMITIEEAKSLEPELSNDLYGALYSKTGKKINPLKLTLAYSKAAKKLGATVLLEHEVVDILTEEYKLDNEYLSKQYIANKKVIGVSTNKGDFYAENIVNACGAYAAQIGKLVNIDIPIKPRKGQLIISEPIGPFLTCTIQCARYNVVKFRPDLVTDEKSLKYGLSLSIEQQEDGALIIGGTREMVGFDKENTLEAIEGILNRAIRFFPSLKNINFIRCFAGLRPYTPDGLPIIGESKELKGFFIAAGHEGDGIALAPITGKLIAEEIVYKKTSHPLDSFNPNRFVEVLSYN